MNSSRQPKMHQTLGTHWGQILRARRLEMKVSQALIAERTGVSQQAIAKFEAGGQIPLDRTKVALARALCTTPDKLFPWPALDDLIEDDAA